MCQILVYLLGLQHYDEYALNTITSINRMMLRADNDVNNAARYCEHSLVEYRPKFPKLDIYLFAPKN